MTSPSQQPAVLVPYDAAGYPMLPATEAPAYVIRITRPATTPPPAAPHGKHRTRTVLALVLVALLVTAAAARCAGAGPTESPDAIVRGFFAALTARDGDQLTTYVACRGNPLCTGSGLTAGYQPPSDPRVLPTPPGTTERDKNRRTITVQYTVGGTTSTESIQMLRTRRGLLGHAWAIAAPPGTELDLRSNAHPRLRLAGIDVAARPIGDHDTATTLIGGPLDARPGPQPATFWAPPGLYTITAPGDQLYAPLETALAVAGGTDGPTTTTFTPTIRPDVLAQTERQIRDVINTCADQRTLKPDLNPAPATPNICPFHADTAYAITDTPTWAVDNYPRIALDVTDSDLVAVRTLEPGIATVTYRWTTDIVEPRRWNTATNTEQFAVAGYVELDHGTITWRP
ncbi:hypothetical protein ABZS66_22650 [Dactylosporangium sp. NPDC005572]|uniref:hypothetical protein n=1 Tax=Dactylosporangium sp. NPDC005572 TaxID=3156889 RepID=UPI0033BA6B57